MQTSERSPVAWPLLGGTATAVVWVLVLASNAYGYHRDELSCAPATSWRSATPTSRR
jgi:hypothetical protein